MVQINFAQKQVNAKIVFYGPGMSGKTTNLEVIHQRAPDRNKGNLTSISTDGDRTLFFDFMPLDLGTIAGMRTCFQIYTVPGQVYYNSTRKLVLQGVDGVVFVADSSASMVEENLESLRNLEENLADYGKNLATLPHIIQFNKRDLPDAMPVDELNSILNKFGATTFEAVANTGQGVFPTLKALAAQVLQSIHSGSGGQGAPAPAAAKQQVPPPAPAAPQPVLPQQPPAYPQAQPQAYPQQPQAYPQQPAAYPQQPAAQAPLAGNAPGAAVSPLSQTSFAGPNPVQPQAPVAPQYAQPDPYPQAPTQTPMGGVPGQAPPPPPQPELQLGVANTATPMGLGQTGFTAKPTPMASPPSSTGGLDLQPASHRPPTPQAFQVQPLGDGLAGVTPGAIPMSNAPVPPPQAPGQMMRGEAAPEAAPRVQNRPLDGTRFRPRAARPAPRPTPKGRPGKGNSLFTGLFVVLALAVGAVITKVLLSFF